MVSYSACANSNADWYAFIDDDCYVFHSSLTDLLADYNTLTNKVLFNWENPMIDHILIMGSANGGNMLAKKATELFLKMFSL